MLTVFQKVTVTEGNLTQAFFELERFKSVEAVNQLVGETLPDFWTVYKSSKNICASYEKIENKTIYKFVLTDVAAIDKLIKRGAVCLNIG